MNVTRAVLPVMRKQRSGLITISSTAGLIGFEFGTAYAASKFGLEGWMQSLQAEVEPFGINTMTVNPGFFRTELPRKNLQISRSGRRRIITSAERNRWNSGKAITVNSPEILPSSPRC